jgi:alpha-amylase
LWTLISSERLAIQQDDHDQQFEGSSSRDMGDKGSVLLKDHNVNRHRQFNRQLFDRNDGNWKIRLILSSYTFRNGVHAFPDGLSDCKLCRGSCGQCKSMPKSIANDAGKCGYEDIDWNGGVYTRTHRDLTVIRAMRRWMGLNPNVPNQDLGLPIHCQAN